MKQEADKLRVLLVEDDDEDVGIFRRYIAQLRDHQVSVARVASEEEARSRLASEHFDMVFLDLNLTSGGSGIDLLRQLQNEGADMPVVVVTGSGDELMAVEAMKAGAYDYLVKDGLDPDLLERTIRNARQRHFLEQERARMIRKLRELSVTDELTGLANRRRLTQLLDEEVRRSARTGHMFAVLMIDLDHFKLVNDRFGHQTGDGVLKQCATALRQSVRTTDLVGRYGGEEFCVVLPETSAAGAHRVAEKLREAVGVLPDPVPTISVGLALWEPRSSVDDLLRRADQALYKAKEAGRNRTVVYGD